MASSFSEIIKMAKAHSDDTKREALEATKRREASIRQAREEQDKKERAEKELQKKLMMKRMEDAKLEEERKKQREGELAKRREEIAKRKGEEKDDPRTSRPGRSSGSGSGSARLKYVNTTSTALTREEKRMVKDPLFTESLGKGKGKAAAIKKLRNGHLPGGALPIVENGSGSSSARKGASGSAQSMTARARMSAGFAPTLTRLNTEKKDQRSIDEISRDLKRGKLGPSTAEEKAAPPPLPSTLSGTQASSFGDWFGKKKDKELESQKTNLNGKSSNTKPTVASPLGNKSRSYPPPPVPSSSKPSVARRDSLQVSSKGKMPATSSSSQQSRKRSRGSSELDDSDSYDSDDRYGHRDRHPAKRSAPSRGGDDLGGDVRDLIWGLMGKNRKQYTSIDVESDDDMEVTGAELEKEEMLSARLARKEDAEAEADERRREMEKKRRKVERDKVRKEL